MNGSSKDAIIKGLTTQLEYANQEHLALRNHITFQFNQLSRINAMLKEARAVQIAQAEDNEGPRLGDQLLEAANEANVKLRQSNEAKDREIHSLRLRVDQFKSLISGYQDDIHNIITNYEKQLEEERTRTFGRLFGGPSTARPLSEADDDLLPTFREGGGRRRVSQEEKQFVVREVKEL